MVRHVKGDDSRSTRHGAPEMDYFAVLCRFICLDRQIGLPHTCSATWPLFENSSLSILQLGFIGCKIWKCRDWWDLRPACNKDAEKNSISVLRTDAENGGDTYVLPLRYTYPLYWIVRHTPLHPLHCVHFGKSLTSITQLFRRNPRGLLKAMLTKAGPFCRYVGLLSPLWYRLSSGFGSEQAILAEMVVQWHFQR